MGKRNKKKNNAQMNEEEEDYASSDDDVRSVFSNASTVVSRGSRAVAEQEIIETDPEDEIDEAMENLTEKRAATRASGLKTLFSIMTNTVQDEAVASRRDTLISYLLSCTRKGVKAEAALACRVLAVFAVTLGSDEQDVYDSVSPALTKLVKNTKSADVRAQALRTLTLICFVCSTEGPDTSELMELCEAVFNQEAGLAPPAVASAAVDSWSLLASTVSEGFISGEHFRRLLTSFSQLLDCGALEVRTSAGRALAMLYECCDTAKELEHDEASMEADEMCDKLQALMAESSKSMKKRDKKEQRSIMREVAKSVLEGEPPSEKLNLRNESLILDTWAELTQLDAFRDALQGGLKVHLQENELLRGVFDMGESPADDAPRLTSIEKRLYMSKNSNASKARTADRASSRNRREHVRHDFLTVDDGQDD